MTVAANPVAANPVAGSIVAPLLSVAYIILLIGPYGQTVGNLAVAIRTIDAVDSGVPGFRKVTVRWLIHTLLNVTAIGATLVVRT